MRKKIATVLILVLLTLLLAHKNAMACGHITTWAESDASFFGITPEDVTVVDEPKKSTVSNRQITFFSLTTGSWNVSDQSTWRLNFHISSYLTAADAEADFPLLKPVISDWDFIENGPSFLTYYQRIVAQKFGLMGIYQSCIVSISGWGNTQAGAKEPDVEYLRSQFVALFEKARTLIDSKCELVNHPPEIRITPQPGKGYPLEFNILKDEGFQIEIHDDDGIKGADGNWKLDWSKFRVLADISDETVHFLQTIISQNLLYGWNEEGKDLIISIRPDPKKLMSEHNIFNIQSNGTYQIVLAICDTDRMCGSVTYNICFGPIIAIIKPQILTEFAIMAEGIVTGNTGRPCKPKMYLAVYNQPKEAFWTYYMAGEGIATWRKNKLERMLELDFPTGYLFEWVGFGLGNLSQTGMTHEEILVSQFLVGLLYSPDEEAYYWSVDWGLIEGADE